MSFAAFAFAACSNNNNEQTKETPVVKKDTIISDSTVVMFKVTEEDALRLVSQVKEVEAELKRTFPDPNHKIGLLLMQGATAEDPRHYVQLTETHKEVPIPLTHFSVDAYTGEVKVMDPLSEERTWITLDEWRQIKI